MNNYYRTDRVPNADERINAVQTALRQKRQISDSLKFNNWLYTGDTRLHGTPLMWWVYYNTDRMPPTDIYMDSDVTQLDINHYSAAMYFIKRADPDTQVPLKLRYGANTLTGVPDWREERSVYGETPIFLWCQRTKFLREPPEYLKYTGWKKEKHSQGFLAICIIKAYFKQYHTMPEWLFTADDLQRKLFDGETPLQYLIRDAPPQIINFIPSVAYPGWVQDYDDDGYTPLRLWIKEKIDEPIPEILKYPGWEKTKDIKTLSIPLHDWVLNRIGDRQNLNNLIPAEILYPGCQIERDINGETPLMCFIAYEEYSDEITESQSFINPYQAQYGPEVLFYENWEIDTNKNHETQLMKWASNIYNFANKAIPQVFSKLGENFIRAKDIYGYTALMIFISSQKDLTYDNFYGQTIPQGLTYRGWQWDTNNLGETPIQIFLRQNFSNENDPELLPMFFYDETMGAPEDWRLHRNNKKQRAIDIYLSDDNNSFSQMPKSLRLSLLLIHKRVKYNCDNCNYKASEENPVFTICHNSHHLCKQCLIEKITEPKCPCCQERLMGLL